MKTQIVVSSNLKNWDKLKKRLNTSSQNELQIGFFSEDKYGSDNNNLNVAAVAAWVEQGDAAYNVNMPPRPFMRVGLSDLIRSTPYKKSIADSFRKIIYGKSTPNIEYAKLGKNLSEDLKQVIYDWTYPPNSDWTIAQKGFNDPLVDSGLMAESVKYKIRKSRIKR